MSSSNTSLHEDDQVLASLTPEKQRFVDRIQERARQAVSDAAAVRKALDEERAEQQQLYAGQVVDDYIAREFQPTTSRTSINGKYYPLKLELWEGCEAVLGTAFQEIHAALGNRPLFPSKNRMNVVDDSFLDDLPVDFVNAPLYHTELRTSFFLHEVLEKPVSQGAHARIKPERARDQQ
ncbi:hypothetical protein F503_08371 [Ophiostoma piceae UAMH 11346]|uniref:Uncharacterized protein n=1 Tax=Ophiostoma piceae (strain UAMH 11346) TaxID=1262450 RepID=S3CY71_OPHP1|nr:hypothetical protein F503_08371 [Ophiostoma piceae UAMH 11346]